MSEFPSPVKNINCLGCPNVTQALSCLAASQDLETRVLEETLGTSPDEELQAAEALLATDEYEHLMREVGVETPEELLQAARETKLKLFEVLDELKEAADEHIEDLTEACPNKPLKLRARRADVGEVVVTLCASAVLRGTSGIEHADVDRS